MSRLARIVLVLVAMALVATVSFWLGSRASSSAAFDQAQKLERGRSAWLNAAHLRLFLRYLERDQADELSKTLVDSMWYSIPELHAFTENSDASEDDREAAKRILRRLVLYFYIHPRKIEKPQDARLTEQLTEFAEEKKNGGQSPEDRISGELAEGFVDVLSEFEEGMEDVLNELYERDLATQRIVGQFIARRDFPGRTFEAAGMKIMVPWWGVRAKSVSSSSTHFDFTSGELEAGCEDSRLKVNGSDFGRLSAGDLVDLRVLGEVYVNGIEQAEITREAQQ